MDMMTQTTRPQASANGKISAYSMAKALLDSGVNPEHIALLSDLENELVDLGYKADAWTQSDLDRQAELVSLFTRAGRL